MEVSANIRKKLEDRIPEQSRGEDSGLSLPRAQVQSLVRELIFQCSQKKKRKKERERVRNCRLSKIGKGQLFNLITYSIIYMPRTILGS